MEAALLAFSGKVRVDDGEAREQWSRTDVIPFDTRHKYMATLNHDHENHAFIFIKGAPEIILSMCSSQRVANNETRILDIDYWQEKAETIAREGQRVLGFALKTVNPEHPVLEHSNVQDSLVFLGLVGLIDPPRSEAIQAIAECHRAGIDVKMITGDHAGTAAAIGKQLGLWHGDKVLTGAELDKLDDAALESIINDTGIFARTSPEHKLRLVMALQANSMTVAMTGDGVNDAPALKRASVGIAMGKNGSEAAKEASEIVLADDNFATIVAAVKEGRTVYDNIKKVISWTLPYQCRRVHDDHTCLIARIESADYTYSDSLDKYDYCRNSRHCAGLRACGRRYHAPPTTPSQSGTTRWWTAMAYRVRRKSVSGLRIWSL